MASTTQHPTAEPTADTITLRQLADDIVKPMFAMVPVTRRGSGGITSGTREKPPFDPEKRFGSDAAFSASLQAAPDMRARKAAGWKASVAYGLTEHLSPLHGLLRAAAQETGGRLGELPEEAQALVDQWKTIRHESPERMQAYLAELTTQLDHDHLKQVPVRLVLDGEHQQTVMIDNVPMGRNGASLAVTMMTLKNGGKELNTLPDPMRDFVEQTIGAAEQIAHKTQDVQDYIGQQLEQKGHADSKEILADSGMDVDRRQLKQMLLGMQDFLAVQAIGDELRHTRESHQPLFERISRLMAPEAPVEAPVAKDAYQLARLIENIRDYLLAKNIPRGEDGTIRWDKDTSGEYQRNIAALGKYVDYGKLNDELEQGLEHHPDNPRRMLEGKEVRKLLDVAAAEFLLGSDPPALDKAFGVIGRA